MYPVSQETSGTVSAAHLSYFTAWKGNISFPISVSADLAPVAVILVYTLHPSGEIIADSVKFQVEKCFKNKVRSLLFILSERGGPFTPWCPLVF